MVYIFLHLDNKDAKTCDFREWSIPGMGYINIDRNWWFNHYTKTPRQVYDDCNYADVVIELTNEYRDMLPYILRHTNFWKRLNNHEFIIPGRGYIYNSAKRWDYAPVTSYWIRLTMEKHIRNLLYRRKTCTRSKNSNF